MTPVSSTVFSINEPMAFRLNLREREKQIVFRAGRLM